MCCQLRFAGLLDEKLFLLRLSSLGRKILFHPQARLAQITAYSLLLAVYLACTRFLWIIDAAERPEPGAHAIGVATTQRNRKRVSGS